MTSRGDLELELRAALRKSPNDVSLNVRYADFCLDAGLWSMAAALCRRAELHAPNAAATSELRLRVDAARPTTPPAPLEPPDPEIAIQQRIWTHPALHWLRPVKRFGLSKAFFIGSLAIIVLQLFPALTPTGVTLWRIWFLLFAYPLVVPLVLRRFVRQL